MSVAVVTGAGIRVGRAIALALADAGYDVVIHARKSMDEARATAQQVEAKGRRAFVEQAELTDDDALDALAARIVAAHGAIDVLVNNASAFTKVPFADVDREQFRAMQRVNAEAPYFLTQRLLPALTSSQQGGGAAVINIVDISAERPMNGYSHYTMSKAALVAMTKALAIELAPVKVRVNGVAPGTAEFPVDFGEALRESIRKRIPMGEEGTGADIANAVVFLASPSARYITGVVLPVDGGRGAAL